MAKKTGLAQFTRKHQETPQEPQEAPQERIEVPEGTQRRTRGKGATVALTVRLPRSEWERLHQLAVSEGVSLQALALEGIAKVFEEKGLKLNI